MNTSSVTNSLVGYHGLRVIVDVAATGFPVTDECSGLTLLKRKENANDCTTSTWQGPKKTTEPFLAVNKKDSEKDNNLGESKKMTMQSTSNKLDVLQRVEGKPADGFVIVIKLGSNPLEDEQLEFPAFFKV